MTRFDGTSPAAISTHARPTSTTGSPRAALGQSMTTGPSAPIMTLRGWRSMWRKQSPVPTGARGRKSGGGMACRRRCSDGQHRTLPADRPTAACVMKSTIDESVDPLHDEVGAVVAHAPRRPGRDSRGRAGTPWSGPHRPSTGLAGTDAGRGRARTRRCRRPSPMPATVRARAPRQTVVDDRRRSREPIPGRASVWSDSVRCWCSTIGRRRRWRSRAWRTSR